MLHRANFARTFLLLAVFLSACTSFTSGGDPVRSENSTPVDAPVVTSTAPIIVVPGAGLPAGISPPPPTAAPTPSMTPLPTTTAVPTLHPLNILAQRQTTYPGSEISIEQELASGANYYRYYAYYFSEGLKIYGLLTVPYGDPPPGGFPAIVFNHGYIPPDVYRTTERYVAYVDRLASSGYVVFRIDYRGHDRSEGEASGAYGSPDYTTDVLNAVAALKQYPLVDGTRIGMWGHSMGGYLTLRAMVISQDIKAGVIWAGVVASYPDMLERWRRDRGTPGASDTPAPGETPIPGSRRWRARFVEEFGSPEENPDFWNSISANSYLADISGPLQLHHGTADDSVPLEFSEILEEQMRQAARTVELNTYPGDDHNLSQSFSLAMQRSIEFFDRYLK